MLAQIYWNLIKACVVTLLSVMKVFLVRHGETVDNVAQV